MTDQHSDRKAQMELIVSVADRMARRMNAQFVADPKKVESFLSYSSSSIEDDSGKEEVRGDRFQQQPVYAV